MLKKPLQLAVGVAMLWGTFWLAKRFRKWAEEIVDSVPSGPEKPAGTAEKAEGEETS